ncbi:MAG: tetratricopeptide repeat protein [Candidatus Gastranaerophilales bacterium]|nr:tetratricopeptide repeat protein [Candidatus Gastranaerophilales bacterium]
MNNIKDKINRAFGLHQAGKLDEAQAEYSQILEESPDNANVLYLMGFLKLQNNLFEDAVLYLKKSVEFAPKFFDAWFNLGLAYKNNGEFTKSIEAYKKALELEPESSDAYFNLANAYESQNNTFEALECYEKAYEYNTDKEDTVIPYFLGIAYLKVKDFKNGLKFYEYRPCKPFATFCQAREYKKIEEKPLWTGETMKDKTLFVYYESALGDTLMYARYLALLKDKFAKVLFKPQICLNKLFKENNLGVEIIDNKILPEDIDFDVHIPLMSIPYVLNLNTEDIPLSEGYLKANPQKVRDYKEKYFNNDKFKIGIKWKGSTEYELSRIIPLKAFYKLFDLPNTQFYSVQKDEGIEELNDLPEKYNIINLGETFKDFSDTAAAIENCDLIICNDTSVAHLAGAMGKPCRILLPFVQNWRWHTDISYSPWYKSVKLFKQTEVDNWEEVIDRVLAEVIKKLNG